jgi:chromosome partitioning protein
VTPHQRIDFAASMVDGRTVGELHPPSRSAQEVAELWMDVSTQLRRYGKKA